MRNTYSISRDKSKLDPSVIHAFLTESYWSKGCSMQNVMTRIENSECFGVYAGDAQVGFARAITDKASFAYLADVFILESHRGQGLSKKLMAFILAQPDLSNLKRWLLATRDAHGLYAQFRFTPLSHPEVWMDILNENAYTNPLRT
ncbi:MAG: GNAT family N-acetyltransferase [Saprospiraceae bacterium]|nr:GNAT family N-acetyltransferase [Saprospiraceae bacterium]